MLSGLKVCLPKNGSLECASHEKWFRSICHRKVVLKVYLLRKSGLEFLPLLRRSACPRSDLNVSRKKCRSIYQGKVVLKVRLHRKSGLGLSAKEKWF